MNRTLAIAVVLAVAAGVAVGRLGAGPSVSALAEPSSFRRGLAQADWLDRTHRLSSFLEQLGPGNLDPALAALEPELAWVTTDELRLFMLAWSRFDAPGALAWALALPRPFRRNASGAAIYAWAFRDPDAARAALARVEDPSLREFMEGRMVAGWAHTGRVRELTEYLSALPQGPRRFSFVGMIAWELSKQGPDAVIEWAEDAPSAFSRFKQAVFLKASTTLASSDPASAAARLGPFLDRTYATGTLRVLARSWAQRDARATLAWLRELPEDPERNAAVSHAFRVWLSVTPDEAIDWLRREVPDPSLDPAIRVMVARVRTRSPARALQWSLELTDPSLRDEFVTRIGRTWYHAHTTAAENWLAGAQLPEGLEQAIRGPASDEDAELPGGEWDDPGAASEPDEALPEPP